MSAFCKVKAPSWTGDCAMSPHVLWHDSECFRTASNPSAMMSTGDALRWCSSLNHRRAQRVRPIRLPYVGEFEVEKVGQRQRGDRVKATNVRFCRLGPRGDFNPSTGPAEAVTRPRSHR